MGWGGRVARLLDYFDPRNPRRSIRKADPRWEQARRVEDGGVATIEQQLMRYWREIMRSAQDGATEWLRPSDAAEWLDAHPWQPDADRALGEAYREMVASTFPTAGQIALERIGLSSAVSFEIDNPYAIQYARTASAGLLSYLGAETQVEIRSIVGRGFRTQSTVKEMARDIRSQVGVQSRHLQTLERMRADGASEGQIAQRAAKLRRYRAENIARTETITAFARGTQASWRAASDQGLLDGEDVRQRWIASPGSIRTCLVCRSLHRKTARLGGGWLHPRTGRSIPGPPAHPSCRCAVGLVTG